MNAVPAGMELAIYLIAQEALTNALKHAGPGAEVSVRLVSAGEAIEVEVMDTVRDVIRRAQAVRRCRGCASAPRSTTATSRRGP